MPKGHVVPIPSPLSLSLPLLFLPVPQIWCIFDSKMAAVVAAMFGGVSQKCM